MSRCYICNVCPSTDGTRVEFSRNEEGYEICSNCLEAGRDALTEFGYDTGTEVEEQDSDSCPSKGSPEAKLEEAGEVVVKEEDEDPWYLQAGWDKGEF